MAFQMGFTKEELTGAPPVPAGWYTLQFKGFKPRVTKKGTQDESLALNAEFAIVSPAEYANRRVFAGMHLKMAWMWSDVVHAMGLEMEEIQDENAGTEKARHTIPGVFEGQDAHPEDPSQWKYQGPMTNRTFEAELAEIPAGTDPKSGKAYSAKNEVRQYKCAVAGCTAKHSTNLIKG